ncbi:MAG: TRAP transporter large permease [Burkholderiales bacterium]|nr:TRAP transporter large permease [Burkholderiales bacterium]
MTLLIIVLFLVLLLAGMDVAFAMILAALAGILTRESLADTVMLPLTMLTSVDSGALLAIPMFILAGELMNTGGVAQRLIDWSLAFIGHLRGALSQVAVLTNLIMAGISGSAVADATATGTALIPAMKREGYREGYAGAVIAAAAMLGPILPPSIPMVVYAVIANHSVIKIFLGGVIPALLLAGGYMVICAWVARRHHYPARPKATWAARWQVTRASSWALAMPVLVLGGIRYGLVTDTEAAAAIAAYALFVGWFIYRELDAVGLRRSFIESGRTSAMILFLLAAAGPFGWLLSEARVNQSLHELMLSVSTDPVVVLLLINVLLLLVGKILEPLPAMIIFVPTLLPLAHELHIDPTHFAIIVVVNLMIGLQTPPVGLLLFVSAAIGKEPMGAIIVQIIPFVLWSLTVLALIVLFPPLATWLPSL